MVQIPTDIRDTINRYLRTLEAHQIPIQQAVLFGSYAKGNSHEWSDVDLALVSEIFEGNRINDKRKIRAITLMVSSDLEVLPFHPNDFTLDNPLAREIFETGIWVMKGKEPGICNDFHCSIFT